MIVTDKRYTNHLTGAGHPESPRRVAAIIQKLKEERLLRDDNELVPRMATIEEITLCHDRNYVELVRQECLASFENGSQHLSTGDAQICPASYETALLSAGGVLVGVDAVMTGKTRNVFCVVRPPGHHASQSKGEGFCLFNNVAIGARYAQSKYGIERVAILDWDVHHGNGTQWIFENDPSVYYLSTHQYPSYPGTGLREERGIGNVKNVPITYGEDPREVILKVFSGELVDDMKKFRPELVMISAGFDSRVGDPLGFFNLSDDDFRELTKVVMGIADEYAEGRLVSVLEGGYHLEGLACAAAAHVEILGS